MTTLEQLLELAPTLHHTIRGRRLQRLRAYYEGEQYSSRVMDRNGCRKGSSGVSGNQFRPTPWEERDVGCLSNIRAGIVNSITAWSVSGNSFPQIVITDDSTSTAAFAKVAAKLGLQSVIADARDRGGATGTALVLLNLLPAKVGIPCEVKMEALWPEEVWPIEWADEERHVLASCVRIYRAENALAKTSDEYTLTAVFYDRVWVVVFESRRNKKTNKMEWFETSRAPHGIGVCPVLWCPNHAGDRHDGIEDGGKSTEKQIDAANELLCAGNNTAIRNADDTLVFTPLQGQRIGGPIMRGANNTIVGQGAKYLSQDGDSPRLCFELAEVVERRAYLEAGIEKIDHKELAGNESGTAKRMRFLSTLNTAKKVQDTYGPGLIMPLVVALLSILRATPWEDLDRAYGMQKDAARLEFGPGDAVSLLWPDPFPSSIADKAAIMQAMTVGRAGKAVISAKTALHILASADIEIEDIEVELSALQEEDDKAAANSAKAIGMAPDDDEASAGDVFAKEPVK